MVALALDVGEELVEFFDAAAPVWVAYVSRFRNQAKRSSSRTLHKYVYISMRYFKGYSGVRLKVYEKRIKAQDPE